MRFFAIPVLFSALLCGQPAQPPRTTPGTPSPAAIQAAPPPAAPAPAPIAPDTVVVTVGDRKLTAAEVDKLIQMLPAQQQTAARSTPRFIGQILMLQRLAEDAEKEGLDKQSPYKEALELYKVQVLANAEINRYNNSIVIQGPEQEKYYKDNPDRYKLAKVRVIYIAFNPSPEKSAAAGQSLPTEAAAKAKIEDLRKQIVGGADFGKLAREFSDDKTSAPKDGDFGLIKRGSSYPQAVKDAVFALKVGEVSEPVKQPNGFYLIKVEEFQTQSYNEVSAEIAQLLKQERSGAHMKTLDSQFQVKVENQGYFSPVPPARLQQVR